MILEYNYDNGNKILDLFKESKLATLDIKTVRDNEETKFVMEYSLIEDYPETRQDIIRKVLNDSLSERLQLVNVLNKFIENQILDNVIDFSLKFNTVKVSKCEIAYSYSYKQSATTSVSSIAELTKCLEKYDRLVTEMGIADQVTPVFKRDGNGKSKKYSQLTIGEISDVLRQAIEDK